MEQNSSRDATSVDLFKSWLIDWLAQELRIDRKTIDPCQSFLSYGMDSVQAMTMVGDIEAKLELRLPPTLAWDFPDIDALTAHLADRLAPSTSMAPEPEVSHAASVAKIESLLSELDPLSDRDVDHLRNQYVDSSR
jgi:acyl carrier protein